MTITYLAPMDTVMTLSKLSLHHCSTSYAKVALNIALLTLWDVQARKIEASWSLNPVLPSSNSLSDSSTTSHSTLRINKTHVDSELKDLRLCTQQWGLRIQLNHDGTSQIHCYQATKTSKNKQEKGGRKQRKEESSIYT